jgi:hypothetical protein
VQYLRFFSIKDPFKKDDELFEIVFAKPWPFNYEKSIAIIVCGKCLVQTFNFTSISSNCLYFWKIIFSWNWWRKQDKHMFCQIWEIV